MRARRKPAGELADKGPPAPDPTQTAWQSKQAKGDQAAAAKRPPNLDHPCRTGLPVERQRAAGGVRAEAAPHAPSRRTIRASARSMRPRTFARQPFDAP